MKTKYIFIIIIFSIFSFSCSQKTILQKANKHYSKENYFETKLNYEKAIEKGATLNNDDILNFANSYYKLKDYPNALKYYLQLDNVNRDFISQLNYAKVLQFQKKYSLAIIAFNELLNKKGKTISSKIINNLVSSCKLASMAKLPKHPQYKLTKTNIDIEGESFGLNFFNNGVIYSAPTIKTGNFIINDPYELDKYGNKFKNLYYSKISDKGEIISLTKLEGKFETQHHIGSISYLPDSNRIYFSETVFDEQESIIKIFSIDKTDEGYTNKKELSFNSDKYSCAHPSISPTGKELYFTSNMSGGYGGTDIYVSNFVNGEWQKPINLGNEVNTATNEMFPYIKKNNVLYFSSNGKIGYGGLDIYYALLIDNKWTHIVHKDLPLNSYADDFAYAEQGNIIYMSSNRNNKPGLDEIYLVKKLELPPDTIKGVIFDNLTEKPITEATLIVLIDSISGDTIAKSYTNENGEYELIINKKREEDDESRMFAVIKKEGYEDEAIEFEGRYNDTDRPPFSSKDVGMKLKIKEKQIIEFHNIYFDFGKADLKLSSISVLDKLVEVMNDNEKMVIELSAHTDCKSSIRFNNKLSNKRANKARAYMLSKGIVDNRIYAKGYGESKLLNKCKDGVECSDEEHAINRRIEVKILKN